MDIKERIWVHLTEIYRLKNDKWSLIGSLSTVTKFFIRSLRNYRVFQDVFQPTSFLLNNFIFVFPGYNKGTYTPIHKIRLGHGFNFHL